MALMRYMDYDLKGKYKRLHQSMRIRKSKWTK